MGVVLAVAFLAAIALPVWAGERAPHGPRRSISVRGLGLVAARPDLAVLHACTTSQAPSARATLSEHNAIMSNLLAHRINFGLSERDTQNQQADLRAIYTNRRQQDAMLALIAFFGPPASVLFAFATDYPLIASRSYGGSGMLEI